MKEGCCSFCEEPLPEGVKGNFCDETCKDLNGRQIKTKRPQKRPLVPEAPVIEPKPDKKKFDTFEEQNA